MAKIILTLDQSAERELADRAERLKPRGPPVQLNALQEAVHFLRGVSSRATMALPAFYLFLGAKAGGDHACAIEGYPGVVLKQAIEFSSISMVSLCCRKVFDDRPKRLTGKNFANKSNEDLEKVAEYWCTNSNPKISLESATYSSQRFLRGVLQR
jgi:hypothetical protein